MNITQELNIAHRPSYKILEEAACKYYDQPVDFFKLKKKDGHTDERRLLFWLLYTDSNMDYGVIATRYGHSQRSISNGVKLFDFRRGVVTTLARDVENIRKIASAL